MEHITVYHGTTITNCNSILEKKKFCQCTSSENIIRGKMNMYRIKKGMKTKDFDQDIKEFLCEAGFNLEDNISEMFEEFLKEKMKSH